MIWYHHSIRCDISIQLPLKGSMAGLIFPLKKSGQNQDQSLANSVGSSDPELVEGERARESGRALP